MCATADCGQPARYRVRSTYGFLFLVCLTCMEMGLDNGVFTREQCVSLPSEKVR